MSSYKKFVAGAATATLVASAIAPVAAAADSKNFTDVNDRYKDAVDYVVSKGVNGLSDTQFGVQQNIKRVDAAVFIAKALELDGANSPDSGFTDVPARAAKSVNALKEAKLINGKSATKFGSEDNLTRGEVSLILQKAYDLKGNANNVKFTDVSNRYLGAVAGMLDAKVTSGISETKFGTENPVKRGDLAIWLYKLKDHDTNIDGGEVTGEGIKSVEAINNNTVEVKFDKALDKDFIREAERNGEYFAIYKYGDTINGKSVRSSETIRFSEDGKTAEFTLSEDIEAGERYYVVLQDGDNPGVSEILYSYGPKEILESAKEPTFNVSAVADKIYIEFNEKMKDSALKVDNYYVYDNGGQKLGPLKDFISEKDESLKDNKGKWTNGTQKKTVEYKLAPITEDGKKQLRAGETYKVKLTTDLETDSNKTLNKDKTTIKIKTPTVKEAAPKAAHAYIKEIGDESTPAEIVLIFDKDVNLLVEDSQNLNHLVDVTFGNKKVNADKITVDPGDAENELVLKIEQGKLPENATSILDKAITYKIEVPANLVNNAVFPNAANEAVKGVEATAQENKEIKKLSAKFIADPKVKGQANLLLEFDQRPTLDSIEKALESGSLEIIEGTDVYDFISGEYGDVKYYGGDTTRKTVVIENINQSEDFDVFSNKTYKVEIAANTVRVDAYGEEGVENQEKLKATVNGIAVTAPTVDKVTLVSANEIRIDFEEAIDSNIDLNKIEVAGFEADGNGFFSPKKLSGKTYLKTSVSGETLTIKTAKDAVVFETGFSANNILKVLDDAFTTKGTDLEVGEFVVNKDVDHKIVDNAAPVLAHAIEAGDDQLTFVFTEAVDFEGSHDEIAKLFRTGGAADKSSVGETVDGEGNPITVTFKENWKGDSTDLLDVTVNYAPGQTTYIADSKGNKVKAIKLTGVKKGDGETTPPPAEDKVNKDALNKAIKDAKAVDTTGKTEESVKALEDAIANAEKVAKDEKATKTQVNEAEKAVNDAVKNLKDKEETPEEVTEVAGKDLKIEANIPVPGATQLVIKYENLPENMTLEDLVTEYDGVEIKFVDRPKSKEYRAAIQRDLTKEQAEALVFKLKK